MNLHLTGIICLEMQNCASQRHCSVLLIVALLIAVVSAMKGAISYSCFLNMPTFVATSS